MILEGGFDSTDQLVSLKYLQWLWMNDNCLFSFILGFSIITLNIIGKAH